MRQFKFGIPILGALTFAAGLFGCADESHWGSSSNEKGSISLTLSTDSGIKSAKPVFRSEDESGDLNSYIKVPKPEDFSIKLEKSDESFSKTWTSLEGFLNYTKENFFPTGAYTMTAYYGEKGTQDFNAPYFEASTSFNVLSDQVYEVNLVAELMNSMVKINYTDGFRDYMSDFHASLRTEGRVNEIIFSKDETRAAFIEPNNATLNVHLTTKGKNFTTDLKIGDFPPMAKTLHNITLDVVENENGTGQLQFIFDNELDEDIVRIDLTDELFTTEAPVISCKGFTDGETIEVLEKSSYPDIIRFEASVPGILSSAELTLESDSDFRPSWGAVIDLCSATPEQITATKEAFGEGAVMNFFFDDKDVDPNDYTVAVLDITEFSKSLPAGKHKISLCVTDKFGRTSNTASITIDSKPLELNVIGTPTIDYCGKNTSITFDYNGNDPLADLSFKTVSDQGNPAEIKVLSCEDVAASRSIETKRYVMELQLPDNVTAAKKEIAVDIYRNETKRETCYVNVNVPEYNLEYDAFSKYAYIKVNIPGNNDPALLSAVVSNLYLKLNGEERVSGVMNFTEEGYLAVGNLEPGTTYSISSTITKGDIFNDHSSLTTESAEKIPNGDFSTAAEKPLQSETLTIGGIWYASRFKSHTHYSSFLYDLPACWYTINDETAPSKENVTNYNTWYVVPSSWQDGGKGIMRNVGYSHNGKQLGDPSGTNTDHYCRDHPSDSDLEKAAGVLSLGSYDYVSKSCDGIKFQSRPSKISFDYEYNNDSEIIKQEFSDDRGYAFIELLDVNGKSLGKKEFVIESGSGSKSISFDNYGIFQSKADKLVIVFKSSNSDLPPIHIPTGDELSEGDNNAFDISSKTFPANTYHAVATGSVLKIDNVVAHYGDENTSAKAPKRTTKTRR